MLPILLCWPTTYFSYAINDIIGQCDKTASGTEVCMQQKRVTEYLHTEKKKNAPIDADIHQWLLKVYGD